MEILIQDHDEILAKIFNSETISIIFNKFYEEGIIEACTFIDWYRKPSKRLINKTISKEIRQMSKQFIQKLGQPVDENEELESEVITIFYRSVDCLFLLNHQC